MVCSGQMKETCQVSEMTNQKENRSKAEQRAMFRQAMSTEGPMAQAILKQLERSFPDYRSFAFGLYNDSYKHKGHAGMQGLTSAETHFRIEMVSKRFEGVKLPQRHRMVYSLLQDELAQTNGIHALQLSLKTPEEYKSRAK
ncbi:hypothetical protein SEUBUCD646_0A00310 [Saccharomyces eubayanus]|uniref:Uncharacterized protein n=2 Tax=Saccharomyces TaxID=4930 RepID=A0ABN8VJ51_SACEU|nr:hypothetical protein DI49_0016 [Saccharomyces eubayanus]KOH01349.1 hypothetical protein DI49_0016 [Saccharomyces eubayanus]CAI1790681.1 hypothetical protein SEUBUCD650_0A00300 [Saccharomyces eubayanus]CAI1827961.1 hypothetical protein SEUBUCD646_0A00310 [Saccharomyces eubayanus]